MAKWFLILAGMTGLSACVTTGPTANQTGQFSLSCRDDFALEFRDSRGVVCDIRNYGAAPVTITVRSLAVEPADLVLLNPSETAKLRQDSMAEAAKQGLVLGPMALAAALAGQNGDRSALAAIAAVSTALVIGAVAGPAEKEAHQYSNAYLGATAPFSLERRATEKKYLFVRAPPTSVPQRVILCLSEPSEECMNVPVVADPVRMRQRP